jgi:hypothetical protein
MHKLDSISLDLMIDSTQNAVSIKPTIIYDTIATTVKQSSLPVEDSIQFISHNVGNTIPTLLILGLIIIAVILFVSFKILTDYIAPYLKSHYKIKQPYLFVFRAKILAWSLYAIFSFYQLISSDIIIGIAITIFIGVIGLNFWKDFFTGIYIKLENRIKINDYISVNNKKGKIIKMHTRNFELNTQNDEVYFIPYHKLLESSVAKKLNKGEERSRTIELNIDIDSKHNNIKSIESLLSLCPWIYTHKPSFVKKISDTEFSIIIYAADNFSFQKVEEFLQENIKNDTDV